jgi:hypothetical protein
MNRKVVGILGGSKPFFSLPHLETTTNDLFCPEPIMFALIES